MDRLINIESDESYEGEDINMDVESKIYGGIYRVFDTNRIGSTSAVGNRGALPWSNLMSVHCDRCQDSRHGKADDTDLGPPRTLCHCDVSR